MRNKYLLERRNRKLIDRYIHLVYKDKKSVGRAYYVLIFDEFFISEDTIRLIFKKNKKYYNLRLKEVRSCPVRIKWRR